MKRCSVYMDLCGLLFLFAKKEATKQILKCENIYLFCFFDEYEMTCNPQNYKDRVEYSTDINSQILVWMHNGEHRLRKENYEQYWEDIAVFYGSYDYV